MDVAELLAEAKDLYDPDRKQTYLLARLEGDDIQTAKAKSTRALASLDHNTNRDRGPVDHLGRRPLVTDYSLAPNIPFESLTVDNRGVDQRRDDELREQLVQEMLTVLNPREREVVARIYGLDGYDVHTYDEIADIMVLSRGSVAQFRHRAGVKLRKMFDHAA